MSHTTSRPRGAIPDEQSAQSSPGIPASAVWTWFGLAVIGIALATVVAWRGTPALLEAWLVIFFLLVGFGAASLGLLMIGHLLGDIWLKPVRDELEPATWTLPLAAILSPPLLFGMSELYPWASGATAGDIPALRQLYLTPTLFVVRAVAYLSVWIGLAVVVTRAGAHRGTSAIGLGALAVTFSLASIDWILSRDPAWWSSLASFSLAVNQLLGGLAAAILFSVVREGHPEDEMLGSLQRTLLSLALLALWVWFSQYLVVWMGNLPIEVSWILRRSDPMGHTIAGIFLSTLVAAIVLLMPSAGKRWRVITACALIMIHHVGYLIWHVRPVRVAELIPLDAALILAAIGLFGLWFAFGLRRHGRAFPHRSGTAGSAR